MVDTRPPVWMLFLALCVAYTRDVSVAVACNFGSWNTPIKVETKDSIFKINALGETLKFKDTKRVDVAGAKLSLRMTEIQELAKNDSLDFFCQIGEPESNSKVYDPQFSALLRATEPKSNSKVAIIGGFVSAFFVSAIILTVVLLAIYKPTVKKIFRPFSSRKYAEKRQTRSFNPDHSDYSQFSDLPIELKYEV